MARRNNGSQTGSFRIRPLSANSLLLAISGDIAVQAIGICGIDHFDNKVVIDATNPIDHTPACQWRSSYSPAWMNR